jgi:hypothetical protein
MLLLLLLIVLILVLSGSTFAASHLCRCPHCQGRGCGGWCQWCP